MEEIREKRVKWMEFPVEAAGVPCLQQDVQLCAFPGWFCVAGPGSETQVWLKL